MDHIDKVTSQLSSYYTKDEQFPDCLYLYGQKSVGKSLCLQKFLQSQDWITTAVVHTIECYANKTLFETIINAFYGHQPSKENDYLPFAKTDSIEDFILELSLMDKPGNSYLIVIEEAEKLRDMEFNLLSVFTKLQELTGINISCIFLSHIAFEKMGTTEMIKIYVPDYCKNDLIKIFTSKYKDIHMGIFKNISSNPELNEETKIRQLQVAETLDETFYKCYLNNFLNVFYKACRDITELHSLAKKCYKAYYAPVLTEEIKYNDITNLWRHSQKALKISLQTGHMRVENLASTDLSQKMNPELTMEPTKENSIRGFAQTLELPNYAKFLLIASFLASHNDAKYDRRLFMKHHGKEKKRQHPKSKVSFVAIILSYI